MIGHPISRARSSAGEHYLDMVGVTGSIPVAPTISFNDLVKIVLPFILICPTFAQRILFALRSGDPANDGRM
jgi:hypothetical protein